MSKKIEIPESFIRNYRLSAEARELYMTYMLLSEYSYEHNWINKKGEPYIRITTDILNEKFGIYPRNLNGLHSELISLNLIQHRVSDISNGEYSLLIRAPKDYEVDRFFPEMPRALLRSRKTIMYQWRAFARHMLMTCGKTLNPLALYLYCDMLLPCALGELENIQEVNLTEVTHIGYLRPKSILKILDNINISMSLLQLRRSLKDLEDVGAVELTYLDSNDNPVVCPSVVPVENMAWKDGGTQTAAIYAVYLPDRGERDYTLFFTDPEETLGIIEKITE